MANFVCRTCLYVNHNEFSFKKLDKVKDVLEQYVPEIKTLLASTSIICEQCYQFLKCMKKFKEKCLESQNRLCIFNVRNIRQNNEFAIAEARWQASRPSNLSVGHAGQCLGTSTVQTVLSTENNPYSSENFGSTKSSQGTKRPAKRVSVIDFASTNEMNSKLFNASGTAKSDSAKDLTLTRLRNNPVPKKNPNSGLKVGNPTNISAIDLSTKTTNTTSVLRTLRKSNFTSGNPVQSSIDLSGSRNVADKKANLPNTKQLCSTPKSTRSRLPATTKRNTLPTTKICRNITVVDITPKHIKPNLKTNESISVKSTPKSGNQNDIESLDIMPVLTNNDDSDLEIVEIDNQDVNDNTVELKIRRKSIIVTPKSRPDIDVESQTIDEIMSVDSSANEDNNNNHYNEFEDMPVLTKVKEEAPEEDNPGFFNKKNLEGLYVCRICSKVYKTSKGLYNHTKDIHSNDLKFFHCGFCSFFTIWRSSLRKHCLNYHTKPAKTSSKSKRKPSLSVKTTSTRNCCVDNNNCVDNNKDKYLMSNFIPLNPDAKATNIKKPPERNLSATVTQILNKSTPEVLKCHLPNCRFQSLSKIIMNQHLITSHNFKCAYL